MTYEQIADMIRETGLPFAYREFEEGTAEAPPFICFFFPASDDLYADDSNYQRIEELVVELYTDEKDFDLESQLEQILTSHGLTYSRTEDRLDTERMYMQTYTMEVVING